MVKPAQLQWSAFSCGNNRCNGSVPVPTLTRNRSSGLEPLLTLLTTTRPLPIRIAIQIVLLFLISYSEWLIPISALSFSGSRKHTTSALSLTPISSAAMVHSYDLAQLYCKTLINGSQGSRFSHSFSITFGPGCSLSPGRHGIFSIWWCLLIFVHIRHLFFISPSYSHTMGPRANHHSVQAHCHVPSCTRGSSACQPY